jgi:hypothetical protein
MTMINETLAQLRVQGHKIGIPYVQSGVGPVGGRMYVIVDEVAMSHPQARELARGHVTLEQIRAQNEQG